MDADYFHHPKRFPKNAPGPFYTTGYQCPESERPGAPLVWSAECLQCEAPEAEAPELLAPLNDTNLDTHFVRQPSTPDEIAHACMAARVCCVSALRYGGKDREIIDQLNNDPEVCDYIAMRDGSLRLTVDSDGKLLPFAKRIADDNRAKWDHENRKSRKRWWQFWR